MVHRPMEHLQSGTRIVDVDIILAASSIAAAVRGKEQRPHHTARTPRITDHRSPPNPAGHWQTEAHAAPWPR